MSRKLVVLSLFAGAGIAETYYYKLGIKVAVANELLKERADFYRHCYPDTEMICGDISEPGVYEAVIESARKNHVNAIIATPPCQGMSTLGRKQYEVDKRNGLVKYVIQAVDDLKPDYVMIENVPKFIKLLYEYEGERIGIVDLLGRHFQGRYVVEMRVLNAMNYGIPQSRPRVIIKIYKRGLQWNWPKEEEHIISLREAIGGLPSLEPGGKSDLKWHYAIPHSDMQIEALRHTPEGKSAMANPVYYPKRKDGERVRGFHNTYKRMKWDEPAPARTTNSHMMSGHNNVHPGRPLGNGLWSDARVLTLRELIIVSSLPLDWNIPEGAKDVFLRQIIGEAIPPLLSKKIMEQIQGA